METKIYEQPTIKVKSLMTENIMIGTSDSEADSEVILADSQTLFEQDNTSHNMKFN